MNDLAPPKGQTSFGDYELGTKLHTEEKASLWRAARIADGEPVLLRRLELTKATLGRVKEAAEWGMELDHPHLVKLLAVVGDDELGLVSEHVDGRLLSRAMQMARGPIDAASALRIVLDLAAGVAFLHQQAPPKALGRRRGGLLPSAVMIGTDGRTRLLEPGVRAVTAAIPPWAHAPARVGYRAPETLTISATVQPTVDVFALGVMLWELCAGERLFDGETYPAAVKKVRAGCERRLDALDGVTVSRELADVVDRALDTTASKRHATVAELIDALEAVPEAAAPPAVVAKLIEEGDALPPPRKAKARPPRKGRRQLPAQKTSDPSPTPPPADDDDPWAQVEAEMNSSREPMTSAQAATASGPFKPSDSARPPGEDDAPVDDAAPAAEDHSPPAPATATAEETDRDVAVDDEDGDAPPVFASDPPPPRRVVQDASEPPGAPEQVVAARVAPASDSWPAPEPRGSALFWTGRHTAVLATAVFCAGLLGFFVGKKSADAPGAAAGAVPATTAGAADTPPARTGAPPAPTPTAKPTTPETVPAGTATSSATDSGTTSEAAAEPSATAEPIPTATPAPTPTTPPIAVAPARTAPTYRPPTTTTTTPPKPRPTATKPKKEFSADGI